MENNGGELEQIWGLTKKTSKGSERAERKQRAGGRRWRRSTIARGAELGKESEVEWRLKKRMEGAS
jgi:hypothetical protein